MSSTSDCTDSVPDTPSVHDSGSTSLEHGTTARHEEPVTSSHADHAEDGSDSMPGLASISDSESEWSTDDENAREEVRADDSDGGLPRLQSVSDSSEEVTDWGEEDYEDSLASEATGYFDEEDIGEYDAAWVHALLGTNNEDSLSSSRDVVAFLQRVFSSQSAAVDNDPLRAKTLLDGLELVSEDLIRRYESIRCGNGDSDVGCSICRDAYIESMPDFEVEAIVYSAALPYHPSPPQVYAFPCPGKHLFHGECLAPWLARKTTCPTCRFDIDPDSLTLRIQGPVGTAPSEMSTRMLWEPPKTVSLKEWIEVQERSGAVLDSEHHPVDISCALEQAEDARHAFADDEDSDSDEDDEGAIPSAATRGDRHPLARSSASPSVSTDSSGSGPSRSRRSPIRRMSPISHDLHHNVLQAALARASAVLPHLPTNPDDLSP